MRRLVIILGSFAVALVAAVLLLPWWLGMALTAFGPSFGLSVGKYGRHGYARFGLDTLEIRRAVVTIKIQNVEADTPALWLWRRVTHTPTQLNAGRWSVDVHPTKSSAPSETERGWVPLREKLNFVADRLEHWLPDAAVGEGVVDWPGGGLKIAAATWHDRILTSPKVTYRALSAGVRLETPAAKAWHIALTTGDGLGGADLTSEGEIVSGTAKWWGQSAAISGKFEKQGWLPNEASLRSEHWDVSGDQLKLSGHYAHVSGDAAVTWKNGDLAADVDVTGEPLADSRAPPIEIKLHGTGKEGVVVVETLSVKIPGVVAVLNDPVKIDRTGQLKSAPSRFTFDADLSQQPWLQARGKVRGEGRIEAAENGIAAIDFSLGGDNVAVNEIQAKRAEASGRFAWPVLEIRAGKVVTPDGNELAVTGGWNIRGRQLAAAKLHGTIGRMVVARWLPTYPQFNAISVEMSADGTWPNIRHEGRAHATDVQLPHLKPLAVDLTWQGTGMAVEQFASAASAGETKLKAEGALSARQLTLRALSLDNGDATRLRLVSPANFLWKPQWRVGPFVMEGPDGRMEGMLSWGDSGEFKVGIRHLDARWFSDLVSIRSAPWLLDTLDLQGSWTNGPIDYSGNAQGSIALGNDRIGRVSIDLRGGAKGLEIASLRGAEGEGVIVDAKGHLPVTFHPKKTPFIRIDYDAPLVLNAATSPNTKFWDEISRIIDVEIVKPEATARLEGTLNAPSGEVRLKADRLAAPEGRYKFAWPRIEALDARFAADAAGVKLDAFTVKIDGQLVRAQGTLPVTGERWREFIASPKSFLRQGDLRVEVPDADIAAIAHYLPDYFAPKGRLQIDLTFKSDQTINGFLKVSDATSRPLGPLGVLQEVNADVQFAGRSANLRAVTARMGGQLVTLQGKAELPAGDEPQLDLVLKGENLPFVRRAGLLLRGDLDLKLASSGGRTSIGGNVRLRDSLFLADLASLIPTGAKETARRPPYFSVETVPLNSWKLDVNVQGERFLRLRTPVFNGTASARFQIGGTLGVPRATGEAVIDEGNIRLPFASFEVRQGQVRLTPEQPEPQLLVNATTRRYGYDLRLELTGAASAPNLTFSSSPPLEAEQVLLMVMAGEAPHNEIATTDRQRVARFGAFFGQSILGSFGGDDGADRLTISSGENISAQGRETYSIEYKLGKKWSLTGEYDEFDDYYGGLKWRFYEKGGKKTDGKK